MASVLDHPQFDGWLQELREQDLSQLQTHSDYWTADPQTLVCSAKDVSLRLGTGHQLLTSALSKCEVALQELIIVTCFWAKSASQVAVASLLLKLSAKALANNYKIRVRLCFSSLSILQKLFQTSDTEGKVYPPSTWISLGLPASEDIKGLDLVVKSIFVRPFSVMHPKFILVDRQLAFLPSCNVSWEKWFEGCVEMQGSVVGKLFDFWASFWGKGAASLPPLSNDEVNGSLVFAQTPATATIKQICFPTTFPPLAAIVLPSAHHSNPRSRPFLYSASRPPPTPLNTYLLYAIANARNSIYIQTPNLTCHAVISSIRSALSRGVSIQIVTSSRLMILEQIITAGTITEYEIWKLHRGHKKLLEQYNHTLHRRDLEQLLEKPGDLKIGYYHPKDDGDQDEPVKSHFKCTIIDQEIVILGSGNMDRASWYTSQELGVAFLSPQMARTISISLDEALQGRVRYIC